MCEEFWSFPINEKQFDWALLKVDLEHHSNQLGGSYYSKKYIVLFIVLVVLAHWGQEGVNSVLKFEKDEFPAGDCENVPEEELAEQINWVDHYFDDHR